MPSFSRDATARTPEIQLDSDAGTLVIKGESYPEDVSSFFASLSDAINAYFAASQQALNVAIKLTYFNSSSARALMELLDLLDDAAKDGRAVSVDWFCDADDDITREFAQDISSDVAHITVTIADLAPEDMPADHS